MKSFLPLAGSAAGAWARRRLQHAAAKSVRRTLQCYPRQMRLFLFLLPAILMAQTPPATAPGALTTDDQKTIYALGLSMAQQLSQLQLSRAEMEIVKQA